MTLTTQFVTMAVMFISGVYLGAALDTFRRFEVYWNKNVLFHYGMEISFWLLQTLILFYSLFLVNQGELRVYILLAILCGFATYKSLFVSVYLGLLERFIVCIRAIYRFFYQLVQVIFIKPIMWLIQLLLALLLLFGRVLYFVIRIIFRIIYWPLQLIGKGCWLLLPKTVKNYFVSLAGFYSRIENNISKRWKNSWNKRR
ncbi:spore cortex biosynthesis protein YabQ [Paraliobacillus zengyii]|uniref:spore cortex biosynthesis protein YabQ n=1 Tax=Paraliobacillus zengyii TaxID=2213194 RepID=UPI000E3C8E3F|nr:spore cortex biosynthesis protein YabQ [Paraliobacillus zengyii]